MTDRSRRHAGFALVELLLVMSFMLVITGATMAVFTSFERNSDRTRTTQEHVEEARRSLDVLSRQLRNLSKRYYKTDPVVYRATPTDLVFQTSDPSRKWLRYCLDTTEAGTRAGAVMWQAESSGVLPAYMTTTACGPSIWPDGTAEVAARHVINQYPTTYPEPVFTYRCGDNRPTTCPASAADFGSIKTIGASLVIDENVAVTPPAERVATAIHMRNQNEPPTASFSWRANPVTHTVVLNGSASVDPEGRTLRFYWFAGTRPTFTCDAPPPHSATLSRDVTYTHTFRPGDPPLRVSLVVCDPGDLQAIADYQDIPPV